MVWGAATFAPRAPLRLAAAAALVALAVQGAGMALQTAWTVLPAAFAGYFVGGLGHGVKNVLVRALISVRTPAQVHGRAFAAYNAARNTAELGAVGAGGLLVGAVGPRTALLVAGLGPVLAATAGLIGVRRLGGAVADPGSGQAEPLRVGRMLGATGDRRRGQLASGSPLQATAVRRAEGWTSPVVPSRGRLVQPSPRRSLRK